MREDQDPSGELEAFGDGGQIGEHHERIVERVVLGIGARELGCSIGMNGTEHVVVGEEVVKAELLDREPESAHSTRVSSKLDLRVHSADLHELPLLGLGGRPCLGSQREQRDSPRPYVMLIGRWRTCSSRRGVRRSPGEVTGRRVWCRESGRP